MSAIWSCAEGTGPPSIKRFKPFDARLEHVETLGVILDIFKRGDMPLLVDSVLAGLPQRRLQLRQPLDQGGFLIGPLGPFAVAGPGRPELAFAGELGGGAGLVLGRTGVPSALVDLGHGAAFR